MKIQIDNHKLMYHPERVEEWKSKGDCSPIYAEIGLTNRCNHKCVFCALDYLEHQSADINSNVLYSNLEDMAYYGVKSVMFAGEGEPLLHEDTAGFVKFAKQMGMDVSITTNGILFHKKEAEKILPYLSWIRFSVDAGTPETYAELHGTSRSAFGRLMKNIEDAVEIKRKNNYDVTIGTQALLTSKSINELELLATTIKELGADNLQIKPYSHHPSSNNDLSFDFAEAEKLKDKIESFNGDNFQLVYRAETIKRLKNKTQYGKCHGSPFFSLIDAKGNVIPCNLYYSNPNFYYGNLYDKLFSEIWQGKQRNQVLSKMSTLGVEHCRKGCRLDAINGYLENVKKGETKIKMPDGPKPPHVNFI
jgi:cyclic pyranopterin phosphate synthase